MSVHIFGIRHHGPGCARSLRAALEELRPSAVLVEGPPDATDVLPLLKQERMKPPVALLIYPPEAPQQAAFFPFAVFSPEWQALRYAFAHDIPARFMDLPQWHRLALDQAEAETATAAGTDAAMGDEQAAGDGAVDPATEPTLQEDPLGLLAVAAGYSDHELWWEHQIEQRQDPNGLFNGIMEAMTELRARAGSPRRYEAQREAYMRQTIRAAQKEGFARIAVVCGAWHAPALADLGNAKDDQALLKGLPKTKVAATWIPWTYSRLSYRSGYGAGVTSPGWYDHLWTCPDRAGIRWAAQAARLLRSEDLDASSANVIETVRLAEALAALRGLPMAGLAELHEAVRTVLCGGDQTPMRLIHDRLEVGDRLGEVPEETPAVPLQKDLEAWQKRLRLKPSTEIQTLDLDLRKDNERERSRLLHRLRLLGIAWGEPNQTSGKAGTFHELWRLQWHVEFAVSIIEAGVWGNTIEAAAGAATCDRADKAVDLPALTELLDGAILADLSQAVDHVLTRLQAKAAVASDVRHLMEALPPLARVARYGDVRGTRANQVLPVLDGLYARILVGLPGACGSLDDEAANRMVARIGHVQQSLDLLDNAEQRREWQQVLRQLLDNDAIHGLVRGWCCRLLLEQRSVDEDELYRRARLALSPALPALQAAAWIEGLLRGSGLVLLHQDALWAALDSWLRDLAAEAFVELVPLLRRAFAGFQPPERRAMAAKVKKLGDASGPRGRTTAASSRAVDRQRGDLVLPILAHVLGIESLFQKGDATPKTQESRPPFGTDSERRSTDE
jgi:hypothetical protein